ncbi:MAG: hypothetical protein RIB57_12935 [Pelagibacterium sp.]|jgi:hypothetical protein|uniref:hypothetical protein n=1 Tax=Pelagibacterium sp. TaxID=1967288 RepID=UPI0032EEFE74
MAKVLSELDEIRAWTEARGGNPIMADMPEPGGREQHLLGLTFDQHMLNADSNEGPDRPGSHFDFVDWDAWFAALKAQDLVLVVDDDLEGDTYADYRFMSRGEAEGSS